MNGSLLEKKLLVVSGKGGVGKTTVAIALSLLLARKGRRVLLCEFNAISRVATVFKKPPTCEAPVEVAERLWTVNLMPQPALREYIILTLKYRRLYRAVLENKVVNYLLRAIPSLAELTMLGKAWYHAMRTEPYLGAGPFDTVVFDAPATGHAISLLTTPRTLLKMTPPGLMRTQTAGIDAWLRHPERSAFVLVSLPEEMPVNESLELAAAVRERIGIPPGFLAINCVSPMLADLDGFQEVTRLLEHGADAPPHLRMLLRLAAERAEALRREQLEIARLSREVPWPAVQLPLLDSPALEVDELNRLAELLENFLQLAPAASLEQPR